MGKMGIVLRILMLDNDDHIDGARLRLWTATSNGSIVCVPGDIWVYMVYMVELYRQGENFWFVYQSSPVIMTEAI
jgi:hypothetical protein